MLVESTVKDEVEENAKGVNGSYYEFEGERK